MNRNEALHSIDHPPESLVIPIEPALLAAQLEMEPAVFERLNNAVIEAATILSALKDVGGNWEAAEQALSAEAGRPIEADPRLLALYVPQSISLPDFPDYQVDEEDFVIIAKACIDRYQKSLRKAFVANTVTRKLGITYARIVETVVKNPIGAHLTVPGNTAHEDQTRRYTIPLAQLDDKGNDKLERDTRKKVAAFISDPENLKLWVYNPDWIFICPNSLLNKKELRKQPELRDTIISAFKQLILLRALTFLDHDELITRPDFNDLWELTLRRLFPRGENEKTELLLVIEQIWAHSSREMPASLQKLLPPPERVADETPSATEAAVVKTLERVTPIVKTPELNYGEPQRIEFKTEGQSLRLKTEPWPEGQFLHLVVRGIGSSGRFQNTQMYVFANATALIQAAISKPGNKKFSIHGFWCDQAKSLGNITQLSGIPDEYFAEAILATDEPVYRVETPETPAETAAAWRLRLEAEYLAQELNDQNELAVRLIECERYWSEVFMAPIWDDNRLTLHIPKEEGPSAIAQSLVIQADTLSFINPDWCHVRDELLLEILPKLIDWARAVEQPTDPTPEVVPAEGEALALVLLELSGDACLMQAFKDECIAEIRREEPSQNIVFKLQNVLGFLNGHDILNPDERVDIGKKWGQRTLVIDAAQSKCYCAQSPEAPLSDDLCAALVDLLFTHEASKTEARIAKQKAIDADQAAIAAFWDERQDLQAELESGIQYFRSFTLTEWQGHARDYQGECHSPIWEREKVWKQLKSGAIPGVKDFIQKCRANGLIVHLSDIVGCITFAFNPNTPDKILKNVKDPAPGTIMGMASTKADRTDLFATEFISHSSAGWNREAERIGRRLLATLISFIAQDPNTTMVAAKSSINLDKELKRKVRTGRNMTLVDGIRRKHQESLKEGSEVTFKVAQYDDEGRLIGFKKIAKLEDLNPGERLLLRDFVLQIGHEEVRQADKQTPVELAEEIEDRITQSLRGGRLQEVDKEQLLNPGAVRERARVRERHFQEVRELMTPRNKKYLLMRIQASLAKVYPMLPQKVGLTSHTMKEEIHNASARGIVRTAMQMAGIKPRDFFDTDLSFTDLLENFHIEGQCWVEWIVDQFQAKGITLRPIREVPIGYDEVQRIIAAEA